MGKWVAVVCICCSRDNWGVFEANCLLNGVVAFWAAELFKVGCRCRLSALYCHCGNYVVWEPGVCFTFWCRVVFIERPWYEHCH